MKRIIFLAIICVLFLAACAPAVPTATEAANTPDETISEPTAISEPSATSTQVPTATEMPVPSATATATLEPVKFTYVGSSGQWHTSTKFMLDASNASGTYYAIGNGQKGEYTKYICTFGDDVDRPNRLTCKGGAMTFNRTVYIDLYDSNTNQVVYSNSISFAGIVPTPTGMTCEAEPQWNGFIPDHQREVGCFAISCYQNGSFFYGNNYVCEDTWPFEWALPNPLFTPQPK